MAGGQEPASAPGGRARRGRQELLRALAAVALSPPPQCAAAADSLGLPVPAAAEHTGVFVLSAPPRASIYLGEEGMLGGEAADRVAGYWRVLGLDPPADCDHLGVLLQLAAELGDAAAAASSERARAGLTRAREALLWEHVWSWAPAYLSAVARLGSPALGPWARLALAALAREARLAARPAALPLALRAAPPALSAPGAGDGRGGHGRGGHGRGGDGRGGDGRRPDEASLVEALLTPVRSGVIVAREDLRAAAQAAGVGFRLGERRYTLRAMLSQDAPATLAWFAGFARRQAGWHLEQPAIAGPDPRRWWADRAAGTAAALHGLQTGLVTAG